MDAASAITARHIESFLYEKVSGRGFSQRSPIMPDVWIRYGVFGPGPIDLLLIANRESTGPRLAALLDERLGAGLDDRDAEEARARAAVAPTQSAVAARLTFAQLLRAALPLSPWWNHYLVADTRRGAARRVTEPSPLLADARAFGRIRDQLRDLVAPPPRKSKSATAPPLRALADFAWLARVAGGLQLLLDESQPPARGTSTPRDEAAVLQSWRKKLADADLVLDTFFALMHRVPPPPTDEEPPLWAAHRNREAEVAMRCSTATVKADAARQVFGVTGRGIRWAVLDTGIDATHVAFRRRDARGKPLRPPFSHAQRPDGNHTRVVETFDFSRIRDLMGLSPRLVLEDPERAAAGLPAWVRRQLEGAPGRERLADAIRRTRGAAASSPLGAGKAVRPESSIDWSLWEPILRVPHCITHPNKNSDTQYRVPENPHGTHVAGILAADWRVDDLPDDVVAAEEGLPHGLANRTGVCPEIELYDLRVLGDDGKTDEFAVLAALQFVRSLNARHEHVQVHGVNLSLSHLHEVSNFACGRTPVCEECERLVASGVVVVAAAGNQGRARYLDIDGQYIEGFRTVSITDPGNAASVITVGATHRFEPHTYGVSYFSSRGPTGDGRAKPDLVAPGEKITSTSPGGGEESFDGTSMAAPHVSGAAALLLCRHAELIGRPAEVKRILCETATDLGRDRYFQGAGLLDILRALESV